MDGDIAYLLKIAQDGVNHPDPTYKQLCLEIIVAYIQNEMSHKTTKSKF
jgi:hypothetical protein